MRTNKIRALLNSGRPTLGTHLFLDSPTVVETVGQTGVFDYVEFLGEYAAYDLHSLEHLCRAAELHDLGTMIKVDYEWRRFVAQRSVGAGFESVLFADSRSVDDVRHCIQSLKPDHPDFGGSFGVGARRHARPGYGGTPRYVQALDDVVVAIMIEKVGAVESLDEILETPGVDLVQWGPSDYCMSIGRPGEETSDAVRAVERRVIESCHRAGVPVRAELNDFLQAKYYLDLGVRHFCLGYDLISIFTSLKREGDQLREALDRI
jgi:2-keto-3-deoxy-L-rhamnonate aldolase RhmA